MFDASAHPVSKTLIIYVASSITNASDTYRQFIQSFKSELRKKTSTLVLEWREKDAPVGDDFFKRDIRNVEMCNVMIAVVDEPSIGVGLEIAEAMKHKKPILCLHHENAEVSRLLMSAQNVWDFPIKSYKSFDEAVNVACQFIADQQEAYLR